MRVIGVDGCRGGWLAAVVDGDGSVEWAWTPSIGDVLMTASDAVAIDIPIGLPEEGKRACDIAARRRLGRRGVSVFPAPLRTVLQCGTYADARAVLAARGGPSMSAQAFGIVAAVRQVDEHLTPADEARVVEAHPEVAFATMAGETLASKRSAEGAAQRRDALRAWLPTVDTATGAAPVRAGRDDVLDALACAWVARRWLAGTAEVLGDGARDPRGLVMRIVT